MRDPLNRKDWAFLAVCAVLALGCLVVIQRWFASAFPEASIEFKYNRNQSEAVAAQLLAAQKINTSGMKHAVVFDADDTARIFLERTIGLDETRRLVPRDVRIWYWHHRWFKPLQEEEYSVDVAPSGEIVSMTHVIPEARPMPLVDANTARKLAEDFLARNGTPIATLDLVDQSERTLPQRVQRIFTFEAKSVRPAKARYQHTITVDGGAISSYAQGLRVPEEWLRSYRELRSKNAAAGSVDAVFMIATMLAALVVFIVRLRRGDVRVRFLAGIAIVTFVLVGGVTANSISSAIANYDTTTSYPAFIAQLVFGTVLQSFGTAMLLVVVCGSGEVLYRERLPQHLAIPRLWSRRSLTSKRVFLSLILGYTLVAFFIAYQTAFYVIASKFGAWSPADVPYDDMLNTSFPWVAVLFAGFFPALSEEFMSRAFSIPFLQRFMRSRFAAIVLAGFIWGFGHSGYPNQPFYIRGVEVGLAGVVLGLLMDRFGLLALLIWHYTVDAVYTALLLFRSGNTYYVTSGAIASAVFLIPLLASIAMYVRNRGFVPDDDLSNAAMPPVSPPPPPVAAQETSPLPAPVVTPRRLIILAAVSAAIAALLLALRPPSPADVVDYQISPDRAKEIASAHLQSLKQPRPEKMAAIGVSGFRRWERESGREEGGSPGGFDEIAATHMIRDGMSVPRLNEIMTTRVRAATWMIRFFTPMKKTEYFVEVDPREARVVGYHKYADENAPGAHLERDAALLIAMAAFPRYGLSAETMSLREALTFQQPNRRDWLFHFEDRRALASDAVQRVSVRVMGDEVTQFASTVKVPDSVYRDANQQTILNVIAGLLKILAIVCALGLLVGGFIIATRHGRVPWKRVARITLILAIVPIVNALARFETHLFDYDTSVAWETFRFRLATDIVRTAGLQIATIFAAVAGLAATFPYAFQVVSTEGRKRFGRHAALAAIAAMAMFAIARDLLRWISSRVQSFASVEEIGIPDAIALPFPAALQIGQSIIAAILVSGAVALFLCAAATWPKRNATPIVVMAIVFCSLIDTQATWRELPFTIAGGLILSLLVWYVARHVLGGNPLAWPLAAFCASLVQSGATMLQNHRSDLMVNGWILIAIAVAAIAWAASAPTIAQPTAVNGDA